MDTTTSNTINLTDLQLRNLAEHIPPDKAFDLGLSLGLTKTDLTGIIESTGDDVGDGNEKDDTVQGNTYQVLVRWRTNLDPFLIRWRSKVEGRQMEVVKLESALRDNGLEKFIPCIDAHVTHDANESEDVLPTVNLSLPHGAHDTDIKQEINIIASLASRDDETIRMHHARIHHLISHPADCAQSWSRIRQLHSVFEQRDARLTNVEMLPIRFTVGVVSLQELYHLKRSIENGQLGESMWRVLCGVGGGGDEEGHDECECAELRFTLELDSESCNNAMQFFKDLDPAASVDDEDNHPFAAQVSPTSDFNAWTARKSVPEVDLSDSQQQSVNLVWRNVSQQKFGF